MAATTAEKRAWLRAEGYEPSVKGALSLEEHAAYDAAHADGDMLDPSPALDNPDDGFDVSAAADFPDDTPETPPKRPRATGRPAAGKTGTRWSWRKKTGKAKGKAKPRVPVDDLIAAGWRLAAKIATPLPPLHRTLRMQAPVAGALLEDTVKGTALDTVLQPVARLTGQGRVIGALVGPPVLVSLGMAEMQRAAQAGRAPNPVIMSAVTEGLRSSLMLWMDVAGPKFEAAMAKEREFESKYGKSVDETIAWFFSAPPNPADADAVQAEEDAIKRAQGVLRDE